MGIEIFVLGMIKSMIFVSRAWIDAASSAETLDHIFLAEYFLEDTDKSICPSKSILLITTKTWRSF